MRLSPGPLLPTRFDQEDLFVDRTVETARALAGVRYGAGVLVTGPRGMGRTSFLNHVAVKAPEGTVRSYVNGEACPDVDHVLFSVLAALDARTAGPPNGAGPPTGSLVRDGAWGASGIDRASRLVQLIAAARADREVWVFVDGVPSPTDGHELFGRLRDELWQAQGVRWIVAVPSAVEGALLTPPADAFFETLIRLGPLSPLDSEELLARRVGPTDPAPPPDVLRALVEAGAGNPRRLLSLARQSAAAGWIPPDRPADIELTEAEDALLAHLCLAGPSSASDPDLLRQLGWSRSRATQVLRQLEAKGAVEALPGAAGKAGQRRKLYRPASPARSGR